MTLQIVRFSTTEDQVPALDAALADLVAALAAADPPGVGYAATRTGTDVVLLLALDDGVENPLPGLPAGRAVQQALATWAGRPVAPEPLTVVAAHRLLAPS
jgi:hypothetical protein